MLWTAHLHIFSLYPTNILLWCSASNSSDYDKIATRSTLVLYQYFTTVLVLSSQEEKTRFVLFCQDSDRTAPDSGHVPLSSTRAGVHGNHEVDNLARCEQFHQMRSTIYCTYDKQVRHEVRKHIQRQWWRIRLRIRPYPL